MLHHYISTQSLKLNYKQNILRLMQRENKSKHQLTAYSKVCVSIVEAHAKLFEQ